MADHVEGSDFPSTIGGKGKAVAYDKNSHIRTRLLGACGEGRSSRPRAIANEIGFSANCRQTYKKLVVNGLGKITYMSAVRCEIQFCANQRQLSSVISLSSLGLVFVIEMSNNQAPFVG